MVAGFFSLETNYYLVALYLIFICNNVSLVVKQMFLIMHFLTAWRNHILISAELQS